MVIYDAKDSNASENGHEQLIQLSSSLLLWDLFLQQIGLSELLKC